MLFLSESIHLRNILQHQILHKINLAMERSIYSDLKRQMLNLSLEISSISLNEISEQADIDHIYNHISKPNQNLLRFKLSNINEKQENNSLSNQKIKIPSYMEHLEFQQEHPYKLMMGYIKKNDKEYSSLGLSISKFYSNLDEQDRSKNKIIQKCIVDRKQYTFSHVFILNTQTNQPEHCQLILTENKNGYFYLGYALRSIGFPQQKNIKPLIYEQVPTSQIQAIQHNSDRLLVKIFRTDRQWTYSFFSESVLKEWEVVLRNLLRNPYKTKFEKVSSKQISKNSEHQDFSQYLKQEKQAYNQLKKGYVQFQQLHLQLQQEYLQSKKLIKRFQQEKQKYQKRIVQLEEQISQRMQKYQNEINSLKEQNNRLLNSSNFDKILHIKNKGQSHDKNADKNQHNLIFKAIVKILGISLNNFRIFLVSFLDLDDRKIKVLQKYVKQTISFLNNQIEQILLTNIAQKQRILVEDKIKNMNEQVQTLRKTIQELEEQLLNEQRRCSQQIKMNYYLHKKVNEMNNKILNIQQKVQLSQFFKQQEQISIIVSRPQISVQQLQQDIYLLNMFNITQPAQQPSFEINNNNSQIPDIPSFQPDFEQISIESDQPSIEDQFILEQRSNVSFEYQE